MTKQIKWDARYKGDGWAAWVLERIYGRKHLTIFMPLAAAVGMLLLYAAFSDHPDKLAMTKQTIIELAVMYPGLLLVLWCQLHNALCKPKGMDFLVLFLTVLFGLSAVSGLCEMLFHLKDGVAPACAFSTAMLSAIALIQSRRK